jgi:hypothetical protein
MSQRNFGNAGEKTKIDNRSRRHSRFRNKNARRLHISDWDISSADQQEHGTFYLVNSNNNLYHCPHLYHYFIYMHYRLNLNKNCDPDIILRLGYRSVWNAILVDVLLLHSLRVVLNHSWTFFSNPCYGNSMDLSWK